MVKDTELLYKCTAAVPIIIHNFCLGFGLCQMLILQEF